MIDWIYSFGDSYTTTSSNLTSTGTYAGGKNWILKFKHEIERLQSIALLDTWAASDSGRSSCSGDDIPLTDGSELVASQQDPRNRAGKITLCNYASSGDVLDTRLVRDGNERGGVMQDQWEKFLKHHEADLAAQKGRYVAAGGMGSLRMSESFVDRRLFTVWIGINDMCAPEVDEDFEGYLDKLFTSYKYFLIHDLYSHAEAGNVMLLALPPLDRTPDERKYMSTVSVASRLPDYHPAYSSAREEALRQREVPEFSDQIQEFNRRLEQMIEEVRNETVGMNLFYINTHNIFTQVLDNPHRYGFVDATTVCTRMSNCDPREVASVPRCHVWVDGFHPTREMQLIIGEEVFLSYLDQLRRT